MIDLTKNTIKVTILAVVVITLAVSLLIPITESVGNPSTHTEHYVNSGEKFRVTLIDGSAGSDNLVAPPTLSFDYSTPGAETVTFNGQTHSIANAATVMGSTSPFLYLYGGTLQDLLFVTKGDVQTNTIQTDVWEFSIVDDYIQYTRTTNGESSAGTITNWRGLLIVNDDGDYGYFVNPDDDTPVYVTSFNSITAQGIANSSNLVNVYKGEFTPGYGWDEDSLSQCYTELDDGVGMINARMTYESTDELEAKSFYYYMSLLEFDVVVEEGDGNATLAVLASLIPLAIIVGFVLMVFRGSFIDRD